MKLKHAAMTRERYAPVSIETFVALQRPDLAPYQRGLLFFCELDGFLYEITPHILPEGGALWRLYRTIDVSSGVQGCIDTYPFTLEALHRAMVSVTPLDYWYQDMEYATIHLQWGVKEG